VLPSPTLEPLLTRTTPIIPPYIAGSVQETIDHDQQVPRSNLHDLQDTAVAAVPDRQLVVYLCQKRAIFSLLHTARGSHTVECILPLSQVVSPYPFREELIIVRSTTNDAAPLTVLQIALVRDCLLEDGSATLHEACNRPQWTVRLADRFAGYFFPKKLHMLHPTWKLNATGTVWKRWPDDNIESNTVLLHSQKN
jgi:hypothetical protein